MRIILGKMIVQEKFLLIIGEPGVVRIPESVLVLAFNQKQILAFRSIGRAQQGARDAGLFQKAGVHSVPMRQVIAQLGKYEYPLFSSVHIKTGKIIFTVQINDAQIPFVVFPSDFEEIDRIIDESQYLTGNFPHDYVPL